MSRLVAMMKEKKTPPCPVPCWNMLGYNRRDMLGIMMHLLLKIMMQVLPLSEIRKMMHVLLLSQIRKMIHVLKFHDWLKIQKFPILT